MLLIYRTVPPRPDNPRLLNAVRDWTKKSPICYGNPSLRAEPQRTRYRAVIVAIISDHNYGSLSAAAVSINQLRGRRLSKSHLVKVSFAGPVEVYPGIKKSSCRSEASPNVWSSPKIQFRLIAIRSPVQNPLSCIPSKDLHLCSSSFKSFRAAFLLH